MAGSKITQLEELVAVSASDLLAIVDAGGTKKATAGSVLAVTHTHAIANVTGLQTALDGKASSAHTHNASDVNAGTLNIARIPTGATGATVCIGNDARLADARTPTAHNHNASDLNAGTVATARLGSGAASSTTYLRGDQTWATPAGGGEAFPVGSVFIAVVATNPATLLGYGTWSAFAAGRVLVGLDAGQTEFDTVEETGGAKTVTLTEAQIPAHTHVQNSHNHTQDAHTHVQDPHTHVQNAHSHVITSQTATSGGATSYEHGTLDTSSAEAEATETTNPATATNQNATAVNQNATATNQAATAVNQNTGGGQAHTNLQPYVVVYMWKRTA